MPAKTTTIQVSWETLLELRELRERLMRELKRRVTYEDVIKLLLEHYKKSSEGDGGI
jgi:hypothetical protein